MAFMSLSSIFRRRAAAGGGGETSPDEIYPYYGVALDPGMAGKNESFIRGLSSRGPNLDRTFPEPGAAFNAPYGSGLFLFYAYPVSYGEAIFTDTSNGYQGGMDGAHSDYGGTLGPIIVPVTVGGKVVNFYLYQSDWEDLGQINYAVS